MKPGIYPGQRTGVGQRVKSTGWKPPPAVKEDATVWVTTEKTAAVLDKKNVTAQIDMENDRWWANKEKEMVKRQKEIDKEKKILQLKAAQVVAQRTLLVAQTQQESSSGAGGSVSQGAVKKTGVPQKKLSKDEQILERQSKERAKAALLIKKQAELAEAAHVQRALMATQIQEESSSGAGGSVSQGAVKKTGAPQKQLSKDEQILDRQRKERAKAAVLVKQKAEQAQATQAQRALMAAEIQEESSSGAGGSVSQGAVKKTGAVKKKMSKDEQILEKLLKERAKAALQIKQQAELAEAAHVQRALIAAQIQEESTSGAGGSVSQGAVKKRGVPQKKNNTNAQILERQRKERARVAAQSQAGSQEATKSAASGMAETAEEPKMDKEMVEWVAAERLELKLLREQISAERRVEEAAEAQRKAEFEQIIRENDEQNELGGVIALQYAEQLAEEQQPRAAAQTQKELQRATKEAAIEKRMVEWVAAQHQKLKLFREQIIAERLVEEAAEAQRKAEFENMMREFDEEDKIVGVIASSHVSQSSPPRRLSLASGTTVAPHAPPASRMVAPGSRSLLPTSKIARPEQAQQQPQIQTSTTIIKKRTLKKKVFKPRSPTPPPTPSPPPPLTELQINVANRLKRRQRVAAPAAETQIVAGGPATAERMVVVPITGPNTSGLREILVPESIITSPKAIVTVNRSTAIARLRERNKEQALVPSSGVVSSGPATNLSTPTTTLNTLVEQLEVADRFERLEVASTLDRGLQLRFKLLIAGIPTSPPPSPSPVPLETRVANNPWADPSSFLQGNALSNSASSSRRASRRPPCATDPSSYLQGNALVNNIDENLSDIGIELVDDNDIVDSDEELLVPGVAGIVSYGTNRLHTDLMEMNEKDMETYLAGWMKGFDFWVDSINTGGPAQVVTSTTDTELAFFDSRTQVTHEVFNDNLIDIDDVTGGQELYRLIKGVTATYEDSKDNPIEIEEVTDEVDPTGGEELYLIEHVE